MYCEGVRQFGNEQRIVVGSSWHVLYRSNGNLPNVCGQIKDTHDNILRPQSVIARNTWSFGRVLFVILVCNYTLHKSTIEEPIQFHLYMI